jgi:hypothetical protein
MLQGDLEPLQGLHFILTGETWSPGGKSSYGGWAAVDWFCLRQFDVRFDFMWRSMAFGSDSLDAPIASELDDPRKIRRSDVESRPIERLIVRAVLSVEGVGDVLQLSLPERVPCAHERRIARQWRGPPGSSLPFRRLSIRRWSDAAAPVVRPYSSGSVAASARRRPGKRCIRSCRYRPMTSVGGLRGTARNRFSFPTP